MSESTNLPDGGSDTVVSAQSIDNFEDLDFEELEDQANPDDESEEIDNESEEAASDEDQQQEESEEDEGAEDEANPSAEELIELSGGEKVTLEELKSGYMKEQDYRRKTQELSNLRKTAQAEARQELQSLSSGVVQTIDALADFLSQQVPPAPDVSLAQTDPAAYTRQKALHESAMAQVQALIQMGENPKQVANKLGQQQTEEQRRETANAEFAKLAEAFPEVRTQEGMNKFTERYYSVGEAIGFTRDELNSVMDHRYHKLAYYAQIGLQAEEAKKKVQQKVAEAPKVPPNKRGKPLAAQGNKKAMDRLSQTGSLRDAMQVDFE